MPAALVMSYASSDDTIASVANGVATGLGHGSATITVTWAEQTIDDVTYEAGSTTFDITVTDPNRPGTQNHPYTVAQALEFIETLNGESSEEVYVSGIVSQVDEYVSKYSSITYWISDDGTTESQLECYSGKGLNSADFSSVSDIQVGDIVTVAGTLKKYNDIYEFNYNNYLVSFERPTFEITAQANDNAMGSVSLEENVITATPAKGYRLANPAYTVKSGTATVTQDGNEFVVKAETDCTVQINFEAIPKHNVVWSVNGTETTTTALEDAAIEFPEEPADIEGKTFVGWATETIDGETDEAPTFVTSATMGTEDLKFYAVFAEGEVTETPANYTLDYSEESALSSSTKWGSYGTAYNYTASDGGTWVVKAYKSGGMQINSKKDASIKIPECSGNITTIEITGSAAKAVGLSAEDYTGSGTITYIAEGTDATSQTLDLSEQSVTTGYIVPKSGNIVITKIVVNYTGVIANYSAYCTTILPDIEVAAPIVFHDGGVYESALSVPMFAQEGATIKYTVNGGSEQTYLAPVAISETTTLRAWAEVKGVKSAEVVKTYTIEATEYEGSDFDGYYQIKNNGNDKFVNVAGRKTVTFVSEEAAKSAAGTVIKVKTSEGQVQTLRAQGIDLPGYVEKAMNYVPKIVQLVVDKLHATGAGTLLGETGVEKIMNKFDESFDPHLYLEQAGSGYRIYGRTPSMKPVVDFYAENKENVDYKLTELEGFINDAIEKVLNKTGGSGASILVPFSLQTIWERMGGTLTNPAEDQAKFYEEVLSSEQNTWDFAYQTAMLYWGNLKDHPKFKENLDKLGDYAKYIDKIEYVRPNFKYYIVQKDGEIDFIYEGNSELNEAFTSWTLTDRTDFTVAFDEENSKNGGSELYTTLYTDFAYTLPEGTKALKVTAIDETGYATTEEITGVVPAQTPVLLMTKKTDDQTRTLTLAEGGEAVTGNLLVGPDWMIDKYEIKTAQVKSMFDMVHDLLVYEDMENLYGQYVKEYEHLMLRNAGTVNNKYFFGLSADDIAEADVNICQLSQGDLKLAFYHNLEGIEANKAFIPSETVEPVTLTKIGDVNRDGKITIADVTAVVNIILGKVTIENNPNDYDFDAADANTDNSITIADVTAIVNIILGKN
ncbi:MAG: chitobiase/beta-hexosaminidase C-terminal domain-containing protein [Bacteroidaceae bacterium]|nr:chitobiase/beta-hexosaminidase C-terminal domain-containing protein [Bacteroidaceae bacterium]